MRAGGTKYRQMLVVSPHSAYLYPTLEASLSLVLSREWESGMDKWVRRTIEWVRLFSDYRNEVHSNIPYKAAGSQSISGGALDS